LFKGVLDKAQSKLGNFSKDLYIVAIAINQISKLFEQIWKYIPKSQQLSAI
jgi:hypothetical protein